MTKAQDQRSDNMKEQAYNKIKTKTKTQELKDKMRETESLNYGMTIDPYPYLTLYLKQRDTTNLKPWKAELFTKIVYSGISRGIDDVSRLFLNVRHWRNTVGDSYMINIYGPQDSLAKAILWSRISDFMHQHADSSSLIDLPLGGHLFTWINKAGTKLSKLDRFLISEKVVEALPDVRVTAINRLWSDQNLILLHVSKFEFGPTPFKLFHSWLLHDSFDEFIKTELPKLEEHNFGRKLLSHEKFQLLKARITQWHSKT
ncbi:RNA-directed DNA polymerase, eukaryota, reverse transcriptase zinc-binding domain protein [Tanacetum coccineum]